MGLLLRKTKADRVLYLGNNMKWKEKAIIVFSFLFAWVWLVSLDENELRAGLRGKENYFHFELLLCLVYFFMAEG